MKYECESLGKLAKSFPEFSMDCEVDEDPPKALTIHLSGSLGNEVGIAMLRDIEDAMTKAPTLARTILDISGVKYASSTAVGALASLYMSAISRGISLTILDPSDQVTMVLRVLGFESFLPIERSDGPA